MPTTTSIIPKCFQIINEKLLLFALNDPSSNDGAVFPLLLATDYLLLNHHGIEFARIEAHTAFDALVLNYFVHFFRLALDCFGRAGFQTERATCAFLRVYGVCDERFAHARGAAFLFDVRLVFVPEIA